MNQDLDRLNVVIAARDREFARAMDRVTKQMDRMERRARTSTSKASQHFSGMEVAVRRILPALAALASVSAIKGVIADLDNIGKTADRLGLTTDALQELRTVAESAGIGTQTLDMAMQRFGRRVAEARQGTGEAKGALEEMGIALTDAQGNARPLEAVLDDVADAMSGMSNQTDRNRLAMKLFDSEGVALVNLLREGSDGMAKMRREARDLGIVIDEDLIRNAEDAQTKLDLMGRVIKANLSSALIELAPLLTGAAQLVAAFARGLGLAVGAVGDFLEPQSQLEVATSNIVLAMADEIRQTQQLKAAMAEGATMSVDMAQKKLSEALARRENAKAAIEERRAIALGSTEMQDINAAIAGQQSALDAIAAPGTEDARGPLAQVYEERQARIVELMQRRAELLKADEAMLDQLKAVEDNIATLEGSLAAAKNGVVTFGGDLVEPVELGERLEGAIAGAGRATRDLALEVPDVTTEMRAAEQAATAMTGTLRDGFLDVATGVKDLNGFLEETVQMIKRAALEALLFNEGPWARGGDKAGGGLLGGLLGGIGSIFGGARAGGGPVQAGVPYLVNERTARSEVFVPSRSGAVLNVPQAQAALRDAAGGMQGGGRVAVEVTVRVRDDGTLGAIARTEGARGGAAVAVQVVEEQSKRNAREARLPSWGKG